MNRYIDYIKNNYNWTALSKWNGDKIKRKIQKDFNISDQMAKKIYRTILNQWCNGTLKFKTEWTKADEDLFIRCCDTLNSNLYIQKTLKKFSISEIKRKRKLLNLPSPLYLTSLEINVIKDLEKQGKSTRAMATTIGRSLREVEELYFHRPAISNCRHKGSKPIWKEHNTIIKLIQQGWSISAIATCIDKKLSTTRQYISMHNLKQNNFKYLTADILEEIRGYRECNWSYRRIAQHYNIGYTTLYTACRCYNIL